MLFKSKKCPKCNALYDQSLDECPKCGDANVDNENYHVKNKITWLPPVRQLIIFLLGSVGLIVIETIVASIIIATGNKNQVLVNAATVFSSYIILFVAIIAVIFPYLKTIAKGFNKVAPYLIGILGGAALILFSLFYSYFINLFYKTSGNDNQQIAIKYIQNYPFISILILGFVGPIVEEFTYRVGLFSFSRRINRVAAYLLTSLIFGLIHFDFAAKDMTNELINIPQYIVSGLLLSFLYEYQGTSCSITAHIINNLYSTLAILIFYGGQK